MDGPGIVWAVGRFGTVLRWDGARVERVDLGHHGVDFQAIHGSSPEDIWIVGDEGVVLHFNGADWEERPITSHVRWLMDVWVTPGGNVWAVGSAYEYVDDGSGFYPVAHLWDGAAWSDESPGLPSWLNGLFCSSDGTLWAVGTDGTLITRPRP